MGGIYACYRVDLDIVVTNLLGFFFSCVQLVWKHTAEGMALPVFTEREMAGSSWLAFAVGVTIIYGMRKRLGRVFRGKPGKWYVVLAVPQLVMGAVIGVANWGASYGVLFRSGGNMSPYCDWIFSLVGWGVLSALSLFADGVYVFGMDRIYLEQKKNSQYHAQVAAYQMLEEQYRQSERLRHDLKNHVIALSGLWEDREWEKMGNYLKKMEESARLGDYEEATGNRVVDVLLHQKQKKAEEKRILWESSVQIPKFCKINEFDLCVLFGNILDNAVEACSKLGGKENGQGSPAFIRIHAGAVKRCFLMEVSNSTDALNRPARGYTAKDNAKDHGIGLLNVEDVVRRYNGTMHVEVENGVFVISVLLPFGDAEDDIKRAV